MRRRIIEIVQALGALATIAAILVGFPAFLAIGVGWPLPTSLPGLDEIAAAGRSGIDPDVILKTLACVGWLAWAQIALATIVEAAAFVRNASAPRLPVLPGVQIGAGRLIASAALLFGSVMTPRAAAQPLSAPQPIDFEHTELVVSTRAAAPVDTQVSPSTLSSTDESSADESSTRSYIVEPHDSWWQIAEDHLGDGFRWREIRSLNVGRTMPGGHTITATTEVIEPAWPLLVPVEGTVDVRRGPEPRPAAVVVAEQGDSLWQISEDHLEADGQQRTDHEITPYWVEVIEENRDQLVDASNPSLIHPGQVVHLPAVGDPETEPVDLVPVGEPPVPENVGTPSTTAASTTAPPPATTPPSTTIAEVVDAPVEERDVSSDEQSGAAMGVTAPHALGVAGALLGVGVSAAAIRRRRRREQMLGADERLADPPEELSELRSALAVAGDIDVVDALLDALAGVAEELGRQRSAARVRVARVSNDGVEVLFSEPVPVAPAPWQADAGGAAWSLDRGGWHELGSADHPTNPLMVTIGAPDDDGHIFLDLESEGLVNIAGDVSHVSDLVRSMVLELSTSPLASGANIILCGDAPGSLAGHSNRVRAVASWDDVADSALAWAQQTRDLISVNGWANSSAARTAASRPDDLAPMVIVLAEEPDDERFTALCTVIGEAVVPVAILGIGTSFEGATTITVDDGQLHVSDIGLECRVQGVSATTVDQVAALLDHFDDAPAEEFERYPESEPRHADEPSREEPGDKYLDPPFDVLVRVLGDIEVVGGAPPLTPKPTAIVTYLALNSPVSAERVEDAIWTTPTSNRRKRLANTISETRSVLGAEHLPPAADGKYRTGPRVITDLDLLERRVEAARNQPCAQATETLRGALDLVTGPVFTYRNADRHSYGWIDMDNWISATELKVTGLAEDLVARYEAIGDHESVIWAARRGLAAVPTHVRLTGALMRAHRAAGDTHAALRVYESYVSALELLEIDDDDADLADLYAAIRGGHPPDA